MVAEHQENANGKVAEWHEQDDVYVDVENDQPQFATVKEGFIGRHLSCVPLGGITVGPDDLQVTVSRQQVKAAPNMEQHGDELSEADSRLCITTSSSTTRHLRPRAGPTRPPLTRSAPTGHVP